MSRVSDINQAVDVVRLAQLTPASSGPLLFMDTTDCATDFDTRLEVFTGAAVNALTLVSSSDDCTLFPNVLGSCLSFPYTSGTTYYIRVSGGS